MDMAQANETARAVRAGAGRRASPAMLLLTVGYVGAVAMLMLRSGVVATPDYLLLILAPLAIILGRFGEWLRDWTPFVVLLLLWEDMRSLALRYAQSGVHWGDLRAERLLFRGHLPSLAMQHLAAHLHVVPAADTLFATIDLLHFPSTLTLALIVWLKSRSHFLRYSAALFATALSAFAAFLLAPTAPPWYAGDHGMITGLRHVLFVVMPVHWSGYYSALDPNPVAADPSLHAALPFLGFLALRSLGSRLAWPALAWCLLVWTAVVYLGEHYVLDVVTGAALAGVMWIAVQFAWDFRRRRRRAAPKTA